MCRNKLSKDELTNLPYVDKAKINKIFEDEDLEIPNQKLELKILT